MLLLIIIVVFAVCSLGYWPTAIRIPVFYLVFYSTIFLMVFFAVKNFLQFFVNMVERDYEGLFSFKTVKINKLPNLLLPRGLFVFSVFAIGFISMLFTDVRTYISKYTVKNYKIAWSMSYELLTGLEDFDGKVKLKGPKKKKKKLVMNKSTVPPK